MTNLTSKDLRHAADLRDQIDAAHAELEAILSGKTTKEKPGREPGGTKSDPKPKAKKKTGKKRSAAVRAKMAESQKKRWAAKRAVGTGPKPEPKPKAKKKAKSNMSDAGRARIVAAQKKRWAAKRKADKAAAKAGK